MSKQIELHVDLSAVLDQIDDDDLIAEVKDRNLSDEFADDWNDDVDEDQIRYEEQEKLKLDCHVLPKIFDRFQLRDHLIDIAGLQSHVSDATLFNKLSDLLEYS